MHQLKDSQAGLIIHLRIKTLVLANGHYMAVIIHVTHERGLRFSFFGNGRYNL
jgi:hypothetical protein